VAYVGKFNMDHYLEIAVSLASKSVTFFIGTGFSKYITNGKAPSWLDLLVDLTSRIDTKRKTLKNKLFNIDENGNITPKLDLSICAQILDLEYRYKNKNIRETVREILSEKINETTINKIRLEFMKGFFERHPHVNIVTTNYDTILSEYILKGKSKVFVEGSQIPKSNTGQNIYHIHGCVSKPSSIILTINDYFKFQHRDNYLSRKFYTLLQETTVIIFGYSLGDFNLNRIFNEAQINRFVSLRKNDIFLITKNYVEETFTKFYSFSYGIQVIESTEIEEFIRLVENKLEVANKLISETVNLQNVMKGTHHFTDNYIKLDSSFNNILLQASAINVSIEDERLLKILINVLEKKKTFTRESGAWSQYAHLSEWLIDLATLIDIEQYCIKDEFMKLAKYSLENMSREQRYGYSWASHGIWKSRFQEIRFKNQRVLRELIKNEFSEGSDAYDLI
jgi:hypothetical protein